MAPPRGEAGQVVTAIHLEDDLTPPTRELALLPKGLRVDMQPPTRRPCLPSVLELQTDRSDMTPQASIGVVIRHMPGVVGLPHIAGVE